jgi:photosystem II stability/assembly factor-like uncharacterized protein
MSTQSAAPKPAARRAASTATRLVILVATRKGAWLFHGDGRRKTWAADGPHFLGHNISHVQLDPRDGRTLLAAAKTGHLGPTIFRSTDLGRSWKEARQPPAFANLPGLPARSVDHTFWLTPGHAGERDSWYAGTSPQGLFRSEDGGVSWAPLPAVNDDPQFRGWMGSEQDGTPDGPKLHSIIVDPRDPQHLLFAMSSGGVHESHDAGRSWATLVKGMEVVEGFDPTSITFHDPHCMRLCPTRPDRLYQQNHCGIYRLDRPGDTWQRIGRKMPKRVGDIGFPVVVHQPGRPPGRLRHAQRRPDLAAPGPRPAREPGVVDLEAPGDDGRRAAHAGAVPRHDQRRAVDRPRRRRALVEHRTPPARDLRGGSGRTRVTP